MSEHPMKAWRDARQLNLKEMGELIDASDATVHRIEAGKQWPSGPLMARIRSVTGLSADAFVPPPPDAHASPSTEPGSVSPAHDEGESDGGDQSQKFMSPAEG